MALVVDYDKSEKGQQRRKDRHGRLIHCCCICLKVDVWRDGWSTYCSIKDMDDCIPIPKFCSTVCRDKGGKSAKGVTDAMKQVARQAEWREPELVYREQTEKEKYWAAARQQRSKRHEGDVSV